MANPKELQKFLDLWGPVIASLPTVINALERENDLTRNLAIMEARLQDLNKQCELAQSSVWAEMAKAHEELAVIQAQKAETATEVKEAKAQAKKDVAEAKKTADAAIAAHETRVEKSKAYADKVEQDTAARVTKADSYLISKVADGEATLAELEARRLIAEGVLADLRAKLG